MCGRSSLKLTAGELRQYLGPYGAELPARYRPRYNVAPSQEQVVLAGAYGSREARLMRWGLVPFWAKEPSIAAKMANARCETVSAKPAFREAFRKRRGLIVADGYYEWRSEVDGPKTPFRVHRADGSPFLIAALWDRWGSGDDRIETCAVITRPASGTMRGIHDRMPVVVDGDDVANWLDGASQAAELTPLFEREPTELTAYAVTTYVNAPGNDSELCWAPIAER